MQLGQPSNFWPISPFNRRASPLPPLFFFFRASWQVGHLCRSLVTRAWSLNGGLTLSSLPRSLATDRAQTVAGSSGPRQGVVNGLRDSTL